MRGSLTPQMHVAVVRQIRALSLAIAECTGDLTTCAPTFKRGVRTADRFCQERAFI
jgi:hypothetical protein